MLAAVVLVGGCGAPRSRSGPSSGPAAAVAPGPAVPVPADYRIDSTQSEIRLLVYRAGPMARFGHNHVIVNRSVRGWVVAGAPAAASFSIRLQPEDFVVDDVDARAQEGADFQTAVSDDAKSGTRRNMLSPAVLDAERFPSIVLSSIAVAPGPGSDMRATMTVELAGHASQIVVPFSLQTAAGRIEADGSVHLRQSALGLMPFSALLGALQVDDEFTVKFKLVALRGGTSQTGT